MKKPAQSFDIWYSNVLTIDAFVRAPLSAKCERSFLAGYKLASTEVPLAFFIGLLIGIVTMGLLFVSIG